MVRPSHPCAPPIGPISLISPIPPPGTLPPTRRAQQCRPTAPCTPPPGTPPLRGERQRVLRALRCHKKNEQQAQRLNCSFPLSTAVRTRLELATPCVTGMYSNQLNYRTSCRVCITAFFRFACAKLLLFPHSRKFFSKKFAFYPIFL